MSAWTHEESRTLTDAVRMAPSVHNTQPWSLELSDHHALLFERRDIELPYHDPTGRDRLLSCGAALTNLELAVRTLGWRAETSLLGDPLIPDWVGTVTAVEPQPPTRTERAWCAAMPRRRSYRLPFGPEALNEDQISAIVAAAGEETGTHMIAGEEEIRAVAGLVEYATNVFRGNRAYQRELSGWTTQRQNRRTHAGVAQDRITAGLHFGGLVRHDTAVSDIEVIADSIRRETVLVFYTRGDSRREHLLAGAALQRAWLEATALGLAASVVTQPLHLSEVRGGLAGWLELPGHPHALLRIGTPAQLVASSPRRPTCEFVHEGRT